MKLHKQLLTQNDCYKAGRSILPRGVMVHSTGANNPALARYVPGDDVIGHNKSGNHWNQSNAAWQARFGVPLNKCVHAFVGVLADGSVGTVQTLPWTMRGWHAGGSANDDYIGFEICEDSLDDPEYFDRVYREAVELTAYLCGHYGLDPMAKGVVICHAEGCQLGIASNHGDVLHWFPRHGKTMDSFRAEVARKLRGEEDEDMTEEQVRRIVRDEYDKIMAELDEKPVSPWAEAKLRQAIETGITDGSRPQALATRQEVALMVSAGK